MWNRAFAACSEFPNDNPQLHRGAIWLCLDVIGAASCERPVIAELTPVPVAVVVEETAAAVRAADAELDRAFVSESDSELESGLALESGSESDSEQEQERILAVLPEPEGSTALVEPTTDPSPPVLEADDALDDIEIVEEIVIENVVDESISPPASPAPDDPFFTLVTVLEDTARSLGASAVAMGVLYTLLGQERIADDAPAELGALRAQAAGWQAILRGDSEDFSLVGNSTLDEWSSLVIARAMGEPARADGLRRELRRRGVAAFGLVVEAA